ncbi:MAG: hypothetical protein IKB02_00420 [Clostridia bacterium]|nr:hypothetical protein [Clostridia bacterium]
MQIDRKSLEKLLTLNDRQLASVIKRIAGEGGVDLSAFNVNPADLESVRRALRGATDEDLLNITRQYEQMKKGGGKQR